MRRLINLLAITLVMCVSCDEEDYGLANMYGRRDRVTSGGTGRRAYEGNDSDSLSSEPQIKLEPHLYVSVVEYSEGYDWRKDIRSGDAESSVLLFKDYDELLRLPSGGGNAAFSDEDMHRLDGGHLYCDYPENGQTVWTCDGEEIFRLEGSCLTRGFAVRGDNRYVLSEPRKGDAGNSVVNLWKEGGLVHNTVGEISSDLYEDGLNLCFSYYCEDGSAKLAVDEKQLSVPKPSGRDVARMVRYAGGRVYSVHTGVKDVGIYEDGEPVCTLQTPYYSNFLPKLFPVRDLFVEDDVLSLVLELKQTDSTSNSYYYRESSLVHTYKGESCFAALYASLTDSSSGDIWFLGYNGSKGTYSLYKGGGKVEEFPSGWRPHCRRACEVYDNVFRIGFDTPEGPVLWSSDGKKKEFSFNGFIDDILTVLE